jgi:hypothetical protein
MYRTNRKQTDVQGRNMKIIGFIEVRGKKAIPPG